MAEAVQTILRFDRFAIDLTRGSLLDSGQEITLRPKAFLVICHLARNSRRLVSKQELADAAWPDVAVSDDSLVQCIREIREKLGDGEHRLIKTVPKRGYLLDTAVESSTGPVGSAMPVVSGDADLEVPVQESSAAEAPARRFAPPRSSWTAMTAAFCLGLAATYLPGGASSLLRFVRSEIDGQVRAESERAAFKDCEHCPEMVPLPAGMFQMGSPPTEPGHHALEGEPRRIAIGRPFAIGRFEVTVDQFSAFLKETGTPSSRECRLIVGFEGKSVSWGPAEASFRKPGYSPTGSHPVGCLSLHDAEAYVAWLRRRTGKPYRLPTEAEWEYAARAGTRTMFSFGENVVELCAHARFADSGSPFAWRGSCRNESAPYGPLPVGSLRPNAWSLHDMHGNMWEWVEDCWTGAPAEIPPDGSAVTRPGQCGFGIVRGGSWASEAMRVRSAFRLGMPTNQRDENLGVRVALSLTE